MKKTIKKTTKSKKKLLKKLNLYCVRLVLVPVELVPLHRVKLVWEQVKTNNMKINYRLNRTQEVHHKLPATDSLAPKKGLPQGKIKGNNEAKRAALKSRIEALKNK